MRNLITRTITGIVFIALVVSTFFLPYYDFAIIFLFFTIVAVIEFLNIAKKSGAKPQYFSTIAIAVLLFTATLLINLSVKLAFSLYALAILAVLATFIIELYRKEENPLANIAASLLPQCWIVAPFALCGLWMFHLESANIVLAIFIIIWLYDTLAYCMGSLFGQHRLFERISPKKSWEGFILSLILTSTISAFFVKISYFDNAIFTNSLSWIGFAIVIIIFSTFGDLVESLFKRSVNVKDSGSIFPGHGGILDRLDSFFFALPAAFCFWMLLGMMVNG
ncbi:MAG: phosphatidate cytidylyltransferase [Bacteroidales bacterium]|jgi:phosphatidate cytidylyltransferase|nr:phosphatidate cytidylyltransferase [Bacteroidales bacterium]